MIKHEPFTGYGVGGFSAHYMDYQAQYFKEHPDELADAEEAKAVLMAPTDVACDFTMAESKELKDRIVSSIKDFSGIL